MKTHPYIRLTYSALLTHTMSVMCIKDRRDISLGVETAGGGTVGANPELGRHNGVRGSPPSGLHNAKHNYIHNNNC